MVSNIKTRQYLFFFTILVICLILTTLLYRKVNAKWVYYHEAEVLFSKNEFRQSIEYYRMALEKGIKKTEAFIHLGEAGFRAGNQDEVFELHKKYLKLIPEKYPLVKQLAELYSKFELFDKTIELYKDNEQAWPTDHAAIVELADLYKYNKDYVDAERLYRNSLLLAPESDAVRMKLAELLGWNKKYDEAITLFREVLNKNPQNSQARMHLARILSWKGSNDEAIIEYMKALGEKK